MSPSRRPAKRGAQLGIPPPSPRPVAHHLVVPRGAVPWYVAFRAGWRRDGDIAPYRHYPRNFTPAPRPVRLAKPSPRVPWCRPVACAPPVSRGAFGIASGWRCDGRLPSPVGAPHPPSSRPTAITPAPRPVRPRRTIAARPVADPRRPVQNECFLSWFPAVFILSNVFPLCPIWFLC